MGTSALWQMKQQVFPSGGQVASGAGTGDSKRGVPPGRQAPQHIQFVMLVQFVMLEIEARQFAALICASTLIAR